MASSTSMHSGPNIQFSNTQLSNKELRDIPENSIIVILTDCQGTWETSEFARSLKLHFPKAYDLYKRCSQTTDGPCRIAGKCFMLFPEEVDGPFSQSRRVYIAFVFVSYGDGGGNQSFWSVNKPGRDSKTEVYSHAERALYSLKLQIRTRTRLAVQRTESPCFPEFRHDQWRSDWDWSGRGVNIYMFKDNSSEYGLSWPEVEDMIRKHWGGWKGTWNIWTKETKASEGGSWDESGKGGQGGS